MSELEKQQQLVDRFTRLANDEEKTLHSLIQKQFDLEELIQHQRENLRNKRDELKQAQEHLEHIKANPTVEAMDKYSFKCEGCGKIHKESIYCMAQRASGHTMTHTCDCGHKTYLEPYKK